MSVAGPRHAGHGEQAMDAPGPLPDERPAGSLPAPGEPAAGRPAGGPADSAAAGDLAWADGRLIGGRYRLAAAIGQGSMGRVWHARDEFLGRDVAVKEFLLPPWLSEAEKDNLRQRMLREARSAARLSHPAVAKVHDVVEDLGRPWMVMELVHGRSLDRVIAKDGPLSPKAAAQIGRQLLDALAAAHVVGVLHRDVKPGNVLLSGDGRAVLTDFGVATIDGDPSLTQSGMVVGTPAFSAPERIRGEVATPAADLWSLGATLYAAVEGQGPYDHHSGATATIAAIATNDPPPPEAAGPLMGAITAFLSRDPAARPSAAAAMRMLGEAAGAPAGAPGRQTPGRAPRRARRAVVAALACLAVALPVSIWALRHMAGRTRAPQTSQSLPNSAVSSRLAPDKPIRRTAPVPGPARVYVPPNRPGPSPPLSSLSPGAVQAGDPRGRVASGIDTAQVRDLKGRVGNSKYFTGCDIPAQPIAGAEATINCQARQPGITVSASSFKVTGTAIPFATGLIPSESEGLNTFLKSTIPNSLPVLPGSNAPLCSPNGGSTCPKVGFSGYWGSLDVTIGRVYCYEQSGSNYYIVWTFDNDSYEASYGEDFAVVASSRNLASLINWWNQVPV